MINQINKYLKYLYNLKYNEGFLEERIYINECLQTEILISKEL